MFDFEVKGYPLNENILKRHRRIEVIIKKKKQAGNGVVHQRKTIFNNIPNPHTHAHTLARCITLIIYVNHIINLNRQFSVKEP